MMKLMFAVLTLGLGTLAVVAGDKKVEEKKPAVVGEVAPHPLDIAFEKAKTAKELDNALLNDPTFKAAVKAALKAKADTEEAKKKNPNLVGPSPSRAARQKFLDVLNGIKDEEGKK